MSMKSRSPVRYALTHLMRRPLRTTLALIMLVSSICAIERNQSFAQGMIGDLVFEQTCLIDINNPIGQSVSVDERDQVHLSRIDPSTRQLIYNHLGLGGASLREVVADPIDLELSPVTDSDILARRDQVYICTHRTTAALRSLVVFVRDQAGAWREEILEEDAADGDQCEVVWYNQHLHVAAARSGVVYWYTRGAHSWASEAVTPVGQSQGFDLRVTKTRQDKILLTHRSVDYRHLYLSIYQGGAWSNGEALFNSPFSYAMAGVRPQAIEWSDGTLWIFHGSRNGDERLDYGGDGHALVTEHPLTEDNFTFKWSDYEGLGGINAARIYLGAGGGEETYFVTRELLRNPVTGDRFALRVHRFTYDYNTDEYYPLFQSMPGFPNYHLRPQLHEDAAGLPIVSHVDQNAFDTKSCIWRLSDADGDGLADEGEQRRNTDLMIADSDQDGRSDGLEVQQGTDPLVSDAAQPLMWAPEILAFEETAGAEAGMEAGIEAGMEAGVEAGMEAGVEAGMEAGVEAGMEAGAEGGVEAGMEAGFEAGAVAGVEAGNQADAEAGVEAGAEAGVEAGAEADVEAGVEAGAQAGAQAGAEAGVEAGAQAGAEARVEAGAQAGSMVDVEAGTDDGDAGDTDVNAGDSTSGEDVEAGRIAGDATDDEDQMSSAGQSQDEGCAQRAPQHSFWIFGLWMIITIALRHARYIQDPNYT